MDERRRLSASPRAADDVITSAGYRIGPVGDRELRWPPTTAVALAAVIGLPDPVRTEAVTAIVTLQARPRGPSTTPSRPRPSPTLVRKPHQPPRRPPPRSPSVEAMPMTATGKIMRRHLCDRPVSAMREADAGFASRPCPPTSSWAHETSNDTTNIWGRWRATAAASGAPAGAWGGAAPVLPPDRVACRRLVAGGRDGQIWGTSLRRTPMPRPASRPPRPPPTRSPPRLLAGLAAATARRRLLGLRRARRPRSPPDARAARRGRLRDPRLRRLSPSPSTTVDDRLPRQRPSSEGFIAPLRLHLRRQHRRRARSR